MPILSRTTRRTILAYETQADVYVREWTRRPYRVPPHLEAWRQRLPARGLVLDLGCGLGQDSRYLKRKHCQVIGIDVTPAFLRLARSRSPRLPLILADMLRLPFSTPSFDGVWAAASLIHVPKTLLSHGLRQLRDVTKPGGTLGATLVHGKGSGFLANQWMRGRFLSRWHKQELKRVVEKAGWEVVALQIVANQERKGRWLNLLARRPPECLCAEPQKRPAG